MLNGKIKKVLSIVLASATILTGVTPIQAADVTEIETPRIEVIDCNDLTLEMLTTRKEKNVMYIEKIVGVVTDDNGNGEVLNPPKDGGYYISYDRVEDARKGDYIVTYCVYNPYTNWDDDVIERWDFIE